MKTIKHEVAARVLNASADSARDPYAILPAVTLTLQLALSCGGEATIKMRRPYEEFVDKLFTARSDVRVTFEFSVLDRVDILNRIAEKEGATAALEYARKELAK